MTDLPNCPLCGGEMRRPYQVDTFYCCRTAVMREFYHSREGAACVMPPVHEGQLRALAALRKPRRNQRIRDVRPWRIEAWRRKRKDKDEWVARTQFMERDNWNGLTPPYSLHVYAVGYGRTREEALRACIAAHRRGGHRHWLNA